jgi:hypothetical protein
VSGFDLIAVGKMWKNTEKSSEKCTEKWCEKTANFSQQTIAIKPFKNIVLAA